MSGTVNGTIKSSPQQHGVFVNSGESLQFVNRQVRIQIRRFWTDRITLCISLYHFVSRCLVGTWPWPPAFAIRRRGAGAGDVAKKDRTGSMPRKHDATWCNMMQHDATWCNMMQDVLVRSRPLPSSSLCSQRLLWRCCNFPLLNQRWSDTIWQIHWCTGWRSKQKLLLSISVQYVSLSPEVRRQHWIWPERECWLHSQMQFIGILPQASLRIVNTLSQMGFIFGAME